MNQEHTEFDPENAAMGGDDAQHDQIEALRAELEQVKAESLREGLELTYKQLLKVAADNGLTLLDPVGQAFNPEHHQAISQVDAPAGTDPGVVVTVFQKGYLLNERLLRPALVVVARVD